MQNSRLFFAGFWGGFCWLDSKVKYHWWVGYGPTLLLSAGHSPLLTQYFLPVRFIHSLLPLCSPCRHLCMLRPPQNGIFPLQFYAPVPHRGKMEPSMTQEHEGDWGKITFSSCLFSMEKLVPLNDIFLAISHSEKLLLRFSSRNLHFYTVWGYST